MPITMIAKSYHLPDYMVEAISEYRHSKKIATEVQAVRALLRKGLQQEKRNDKIKAALAKAEAAG